MQVGHQARVVDEGVEQRGDGPPGLGCHAIYPRVAAEVAAQYAFKLQVGFMRRFHPYHAKIKEILDRGTLGRIVEALRDRFGFADDIEVSIEANPEDLDRGTATALADKVDPPQVTVGEDWKITFDGQYRPRLYWHSGKDFVDKAETIHLTCESCGASITWPREHQLMVTLGVWSKPTHCSDCRGAGKSLESDPPPAD